VLTVTDRAHSIATQLWETLRTLGSATIEDLVKALPHIELKQLQNAIGTLQRKGEVLSLHVPTADRRSPRVVYRVAKQKAIVKGPIRVSALHLEKKLALLERLAAQHYGMDRDLLVGIINDYKTKSPAS
jgi:hypothetical protein